MKKILFISVLMPIFATLCLADSTTNFAVDAECAAGNVSQSECAELRPGAMNERGNQQEPISAGQKDSIFAGLEPSVGGLVVVRRVLRKSEPAQPKQGCVSLSPNLYGFEEKATDSASVPLSLLGAKDESTTKAAQYCTGCDGHMFRIWQHVCGGDTCRHRQCVSGYGAWDDGCIYCRADDDCAGCHEDRICQSP